jgi:hypothetical protein
MAENLWDFLLASHLVSAYFWYSQRLVEAYHESAGKDAVTLVFILTESSTTP